MTRIYNNLIELTGNTPLVRLNRITEGSVAEVLAKNEPVPIEMIGVQDRWGESGSPDELMKEFHLLAEDIKKAVKKVIRRK